MNFRQGLGPSNYYREAIPPRTNPSIPYLLISSLDCDGSCVRFIGRARFIGKRGKRRKTAEAFQKRHSPIKPRRFRKEIDFREEPRNHRYSYRASNAASLTRRGNVIIKSKHVTSVQRRRGKNSATHPCCRREFYSGVTILDWLNDPPRCAHRVSCNSGMKYSVTPEALNRFFEIK